MTLGKPLKRPAGRLDVGVNGDQAARYRTTSSAGIWGTSAIPAGSPRRSRGGGCAERLSRFANSGAQRIFLWPLGDELEQLELLFREHVAPCVLVDKP